MADTVILAERTLTGFVDGALQITPAPFALTIGETYRVVWDGVEHECVCFDMDGMPSITDADDMENPTSVTFMIFALIDESEGVDAAVMSAFDTSSGSPAPDTTATSHTVAIYQVAEEDKQYLVCGSSLKMVADAIRAKTGDDSTLVFPSDFASEIANIETGGAGAKPFDCHSVTFMNGSEVLYVRSVADGDTCADPVSRNLIEAPTKESDVQYSYAFDGWSATDGGGLDTTILQNVTEDKTVYVHFKATVQTYTITFYDEDGATVLATKQVAYGSVPSYTPTKDGYTFNGWTPALTAVTGDASYTASWLAKLDFNALTWEQIAEYANAGTAASVFDLGATKTWSGKNGNSYTAKIVGFNHDDLADGSGKAGITLMLTSLFRNGYWHHGGTDAQKQASWDESYIRSSMAELTSILGTACLAVVKTVKKKYRKYSTSTYETTDDVFFLPAAVEVGGGYITGEGETYAAFAESSIITNHYGTAQQYWTRTKAGYGAVYIVSTTGSITSTSQATSSPAYVGPCFFCV